MGALKWGVSRGIQGCPKGVPFVRLVILSTILQVSDKGCSGARLGVVFVATKGYMLYILAYLYLASYNI